jgi:predicted permease
MEKIFLLSTVGFFCAHWPKNDPLLTVDTLRCLSRLINLLFLPAIIVSIFGSSLSFELLQETGVLIFFAFLINCISYGLAHTIGHRMCEKDIVLFRAMTVAIGSPNINSLPILLMPSLCKHSLINHDYDDDEVTCSNTALTMVFVYSIGWHLMFWSYGYPCLQSLEMINKNKSHETLSTDEHFYSISNTIKVIKNVLMNPAMIAIFIGFFIGLIKPLQDILFTGNSFMRPFGSSLVTLGEPVVCLFCLIMSGSLAHADFSSFKFHEYIDRLYLFFNNNNKDNHKKIENKMDNEFDSNFVLNKIIIDNNNNNNLAINDFEIEINDDLIEKELIDINSKNENDTFDGNDIIHKNKNKRNNYYEKKDDFRLPSWNTVLSFLLCRLFLCVFL